MGAFNELSKHFFHDIVTKAREMSYSESNILILEGNEEELRNRFPQVYSDLLSCNHNRDMRTPIQYGQDLVASWLFEDCIVNELKNNGFDIKLAGADCNREILSNSKVSSNSDTLISLNGKSRQMELMSDYTGYWSRTKHIDLRDEKYNKLKNTSSLFLGISTTDTCFILIDFSKNVTHKYDPCHRAYGGKPCYTIQIASNDLIKFTIQSLVSTIKNAL